MTPARGGMRLGLCLAAFGGMALEKVLAEVIGYGPLSLDLPTDTTLGLVDARRCFADAGYRDEVAQLLAGAQARGQPVGCVSNSRDAQLLLGPHGPHIDSVCPGFVREKCEHVV